MLTQSAFSTRRALALIALAGAATAQKTTEQLRDEDFGLADSIFSFLPQSYSAGCIEDILTLGYWEVTNLTFSNRVAITSDGAKGVQALGFDIGSQLLGWSAHCGWEYVGDMFRATQDVECTEGNGLDAPVMGFQWEGEERITVGVTQSWLCPRDEDGEGTRFELLASIDLTPSIEDDGAFNLEQDLIRVPYHITSPISLTPSNEIPTPPLGATDPECRRASQDSSWTISNLTWAWGTGGRDDQYTSGFVQLDIVHEPSGNAITCLSMGPGIVPDTEKRPGVHTSGGVHWEYCTGLGRNESYSGEYLLQTAMQFNGYTESVELVQTWYCDENEESEAVRYVSYGAISIGEVDCREADETSLNQAFGADNIGWFTYDGHICTGLPTETRVPSTIIHEDVLLPDAFSYRRSRKGGCLATSLVEDNWYWDFYPGLLNYRLSGDNTTVQFMQATMEPGVPTITDRLVCFAPENSLFGDCREPVIPQARSNTARGVLDPETLVFSIEQSWECADRSPSNPVRFEAKGSIDMSEYECEGSRSECMADTVRIPMQLTMHQGDAA